MVNSTSQTIVINHNRVYHISMAGNPALPALLLLHGFTGSHASWSDLLPALTQVFRVVMPDLPGHGQSFYSSDPHEMSLHVTARDLQKILEQLGITKAGVLGYSMGGRLALHMPLYAPNMVDFLIVESATAGIDNLSERILRQQHDEQLASYIETRGLEWFVPYWSQIPLFASQRTLPNAVLQRQEEIRFGHHPYGLAQSLRAAGTGHQASLWPILPYYRAPTLIVTGQYDDKYQRIGQKLHRMIPNSQWVNIAHSGHTVHLEQPASFLSAIEQFYLTILSR
ncbi:2-succinyl-6-hydroxy-2,4-cyclohexadiene-1-carboxylate synthase [Sulfobacillus thermosulfidooxidans]|uniref:2-succinyl-6-hydroxy-2, 4-cyclohexadiene-1-carboxylate synthase n=1 Tax=Sulfobacillus thermosulfidooxidans TaxID=28034 RepID=UPI000687FA82|nr:2-succinyl-6-hydroxy-2,4-cyclohexadiene-1-carboxylate synthase [Sulfobacillus thermosulfidooxidans]